jgi:hypothetical protein
VYNEKTANYYSDHPNDNPPKWHTPIERPEWWLALVAAITAYVIWLQAREMARATSVRKEQTQASKVAADAALLNAQAVINAERPWLVVSVDPDKGNPELFRFGCLNQGRTPAKVISVSVKACFVKDQYALPIPPDYSTLAEPPRLNLIVNRDSFLIEKGVNAEAYIVDNGKKDLIARSVSEITFSLRRINNLQTAESR